MMTTACRRWASWATAAVGLSCVVIACGDPSALDDSRFSIEGEPTGTVQVGGAFNQCPQLNLASASATRAPVGGSVELVAAAFDPDGDPISYRWSASEGAFSFDDGAETEFRCDAEFNTTVELRISDDEFVACQERWSTVVRCGGPVPPPVCEAVSVTFVRIDVDRNIEGGDRGKELVAIVKPDDAAEAPRNDLVAATTANGGRVRDLTDGTGALDVAGYKTRAGLTAALDVGSTIDIANDLVREGLRFNGDRFGLDKSGVRKKEGFPGDEGESGGAKDLNLNELLVIEMRGPGSSIEPVSLDVLPRAGAAAVSGRVFGLRLDGTSYEVTQVVPFGPAAGTLPVLALDSGAPSSTLGITIDGGARARVGVALGGGLCH